MRRTRLSFLAAVLCLSLLVISPAFAQFRASIQGTVTDQSGAVLGGATVNIVQKATGVTASTVSTPEGFYRISGLRPGLYTVTVEAPNFKKSVSDVEVAAEQSRDFDVSLKPGGANESVTVTAQAEGIDTQSTNISKGITEQEVRSLPQSGRDPYELLRLTPGIFGDASRGATGGAVFLPNGTGPGGSNSSIFQTENQVQISAFGQRVSSNNYQIDGVGVNSLTWGGAAVVTPNQESVQEIMVLPNSYYAEDGRNSGAQVKVISKSGTNNWHGSAAFKYDEPGWNAYNKYGDNFGQNARSRVQNKERQFAGGIGGPIVKDKLFFFFSYEGLRQSNDAIKSTWVETPQYRSLIRAARAGGIAAKVLGMPGVEPRIASQGTQTCVPFGANPCQVIGGGVDIGSPFAATGQYVPLDGAHYGGSGLDGIPDVMNVEIKVPHTTRGNQYNGRVDYNLGKHQIFGSTYISKLETINADDASGARPMDDIRNTPLNLSGTLGWIWSINNSLLNELRINGTRFAFNQVQASSATNWGVPRIEIEGLPGELDRIRFGAPWGETSPGIFAENTYELRDNMSKVWKTHAFKWGIQITKEQDNNNLNGGARPLYSFVRPWNFANDTPIFYQINADPRTGGPGDAQRHFRSTYYGTYMQDEWRLRPSLTLTLGLRYEYFPPIEEKDGILSNLFLGTNGLINSQVRTTSTLNQPDKNNFAPRFGFAWSPASLDNKFVVRGGYGLAYNRITDSNFTNSRGNPPFFARYNICCGTSAADFSTPYAGGQILYALGTSSSPFSYPINPALAQGIDPISGGAAGGSVEIYGSRQNMPIPYVQNFSLDLQYELPANMTLETGYHGSIGRKLIRLVNQNFLGPPNPKFFAVYFPTPDTNSEYNALVTHLRRRFTRGLMFDFTHTWSRSIDYISNEGPGFTTNQTDPAHLKTERGPSDYDHTHEIVLSGLYELPYKNHSGFLGNLLSGWQVSPIWTWHTGFPWTPMTGTQQSVPVTGAATISPTRPIGTTSAIPLEGSGNDSFTRPGGNFPGGGATYFNITAPGPPGIGRNSFRGPRYSSIDMAIGKDTKLPFLGEQTKLNVRMNVFNVFNQLNLAPFQFGSGSVKIEDSHFGMAQQGLAGRVVELQARFSF